ncbi:class I SAM-dependent methyltransferase [Paramaledivibacter caminithermalis]|uniref:Methyltransferase domain-containing protein n=1 Tax=Paramaledivibacter caminithermalis (strain DSM 15212 / CIP 107654 / DViRD3) TaxID=1121301 RepID=A0A1M6PVY7_PARC5|nr:class I SAM-dependent methyltransferase [Paramaledivibacter caminithermalis]SHK12037.1 Methyltransferase domain-containing protein [Paramaledivibacter caminithermalis DSM 15212]
MTFYEELSKYYDIVFPLGKLKLEFMIKSFKDKKKILDLAAGTGNYSISLSKLGYNVIAVDLDGEMIKKIETKNRKEKTNVIAFKLDMKDIDRLKDYKFDGIICIGNSLVHLDSAKEIKDVLGKMYSLLNQNGVVILQIVNYDRILRYDIKELPPIDRLEYGVRFIRNYKLEGDKILFKTKLIINNNRTYDNCIKLYPLQSQALVNMLKEVGFKDIKLYGGFDEKEYTLDSFPLVVKAFR